MRAEEIRRRFLDYFRRRGHVIVPSSPLIPRDDPTLLFTNAGMVQFKPFFLGTEPAPFPRAASVQKCMRAGGKHNDLENVGYTSRHHTFFEMLGNFSFGDYFKREAIVLAWEFLTGQMGLDPERLWVSVYREDEEAARIWEQEVGLPPERIVPQGEEDNFWSMGETGPCGPCSEIIYDRGEEAGCGRPECAVGCGCDRFLEVWNLVFMQYERDAAGRLTRLPRPSIDTGMGLERIAAVVQGAPTNYETDLFRDIIRHIEELCGRSYAEAPRAFRVIADHARAATFLIAEGLLPSNEAQGYVLRRIIRRAARYGRDIGLDKPFLWLVSGAVVDVMQGAYPELSEARAYVARAIRAEEERFAQTLEAGLRLLEEEARRAEGGTLPGEVVFRLYDTYGFPPELTRELCEARGLRVDEGGFERLMEEQRRRAREAWRGRMVEVERAMPEVRSEFTGYGSLRAEARLLVLLRDGQPVEEAHEGESLELIVDRTPFYPEGGGQVGDAGLLRTPSGEVEVVDAQRRGEAIVHRGRVRRGTVRRDQEAFLEVDEARRRSISAHHTATHLLHAALREVVGTHARQSGSLVAPDRLRFDFSHFSPLEEGELRRVEERVNRWVQRDDPVEVLHLSYKEAVKRGAMALFGEKYGQQVRVVKIGDYSLELCGGTHLERTGQIGPFKILSETGVAAGVRRIEAVAGMAALRWMWKLEDEWRECHQLLRAKPGELLEKLRRLLAHQKETERQIAELRARLATKGMEALLAQAREIRGVRVLAAQVEAEDQATLRELADRLRDRLRPAVVVLGAAARGRAMLVATVSKELAGRVDARPLVAEVARRVEGAGGGRPDMAQAGGKRPERLPEALEAVYPWVAEAL